MAQKPKKKRELNSISLAAAYAEDFASLLQKFTGDPDAKLCFEGLAQAWDQMNFRMIHENIIYLGKEQHFEFISDTIFCLLLKPSPAIIRFSVIYLAYLCFNTQPQPFYPLTVTPVAWAELHNTIKLADRLHQTDVSEIFTNLLLANAFKYAIVAPLKGSLKEEAIPPQQLDIFENRELSEQVADIEKKIKLYKQNRDSLL